MIQKALIVDDYKPDRGLVARVLKRDNFEVIEAGTAGEADRLLAENPDVALIISDLKLPCMPGMEFLAQCKEKYPDTILVAISGHDDLREKAMLRDIGVIFVVEKPFSSIEMPPILAALDIRRAAFNKGRAMKPSWMHRTFGGLVLVSGAVAWFGFDPAVTRIAFGAFVLFAGVAIALGVDRAAIMDVISTVRKKNE